MRSPVNNQISVPVPVRFTFDFPEGAFSDRYIILHIATDAGFTQGLRVLGFIRDAVREIALDRNIVYYYKFVFILTPAGLPGRPGGPAFAWSENGLNTFSQTWVFRTNASEIPNPVELPPPGDLPPLSTPPIAEEPDRHGTKITFASIGDVVTSTAGLVIIGASIVAALVWYFFLKD
jgi:hypothetical protein